MVFDGTLALDDDEEIATLVRQPPGQSYVMVLYESPADTVSQWPFNAWRHFTDKGARNGDLLTVNGDLVATEGGETVLRISGDV